MGRRPAGRQRTKKAKFYQGTSLEPFRTSSKQNEVCDAEL